jgi:prepilin signal peptidase PulO-like enzyme (type II secretory pathway)
MGTGLGPALDALLAGLLGLLIGSFLNVVIYRLPKMMERQWAQECAELAEAAGIRRKIQLAGAAFALLQLRPRHTLV